MKEKGLTLVEGLLTLAIATIVGTLLMVIIVNTGGLFYKQSGKLEQGLNINDALAKVSETIRSASAIATSYTSGLETYTSGQNQLVLKVPSIDSSGNIISNTFDHFVFFLDANKLRFKAFPDPTSTRASQDQIFSTNVDRLVFEYFGQPDLATKIRITLSLRQKAGAGYEQNIATTEANLRND